MSTHDNTINRDSQTYWNKRAATFTRDATVEYERWLLDLLVLEDGDEVLDMGCATGTLAVPLARAGHRVHGCDFAEAMLAILDERAAADKLPITSHLLAWEDDWEEAGLGENSVDVAFASRSLMSGDVPACVRKLDAAARSRAAVVVQAGAENAKSSTSCQSLMLDAESRSDTIPAIEVKTNKADIGHEAKIGRISDDAVFYLMSRGVSEEDARALIVSGFADNVGKELPLEYAVEMNNLIRLEMKGAIG